ncbi:hypothetical protein [Rhizobium leguminosarum]|uniref:hypothetical protein n=1 Tax=Rhizobium leguminosarum TaxID=384 RepID=UPI003F9B35B5
MMRRAAIIDIARSFAILNAERRPHLADREPATANAGLLQQPQIEIVARDRGRGLPRRPHKPCHTPIRLPTARI